MEKESVSNNKSGKLGYREKNITLNDELLKAD